MTTTQTTIRAVDIRSWGDFKLWWDKRIAVRVKGVVYTLFVTFILVIGGQYQISHVNAANLDRICDTREANREDLRKALYAIVDISDLFPEEEIAQAYQSSRTLIIDTLIDPADDREGCNS